MIVGFGSINLDLIFALPAIPRAGETLLGPQVLAAIRSLYSDRELGRALGLYGAMIGRQCVVSCGPMMAAMTLGDQHELILMVGMTAVVLAERFRHRTPRRASAAVVGLLAVLAL